MIPSLIERNHHSNLESLTIILIIIIIEFIIYDTI